MSIPTYTVLGLDPGLAFTGFAIAKVRGRSCSIESVQAIGLLTSVVDHSSLTRSHDRYARATNINAQLRSLVDDFEVDMLAVEHSFLSKESMSTNFAFGMLFGAIAALDLPTLLVWPHQVKAAAARKGASKAEVIAWAIEQTRPHKVPWPTSTVPNKLGLQFEGAQVAVFAEHPADALAAIQAGIRTEEWLTAEDRPTEYAPDYEPT